MYRSTLSKKTLYTLKPITPSKLHSTLIAENKLSNKTVYIQLGHDKIHMITALKLFTALFSEVMFSNEIVD